MWDEITLLGALAKRYISFMPARKRSSLSGSFIGTSITSRPVAVLTVEGFYIILISIFWLGYSYR